MLDCAPLVVACELGLFHKRGLRVLLKKELGWGTIRERLLHGELYAVHAPATMAYAIQCGLGGVARPCVTGFIFSMHGGSVTLSKELRESGVRDLPSLRSSISQRGASRKLRFGVVTEISTEAYLLRRWIASGGIDPDRDISVTAVPCRAIHQQLLDGHLDGYCMPEPWNSLAVQSGAGRIAAPAGETETSQAGNNLLILKQSLNQRPDDHVALIAALIEASRFCESAANRPGLVSILARPEYLDVPETVLHAALSNGTPPNQLSAYFGRVANRPDRTKARQVAQTLRALLDPKCRSKLRADVIRRVFREDLYDQAERGAEERLSSAAGQVSRPRLPASRKSPRSLRVAFAG